MKPKGLSCSIQKKKSIIKFLLTDKSKRRKFPINGHLVSFPAALFSAEVSLYRRGRAGEKKKESARGGRWEGKREEALSIFRLLQFLLGYPGGTSAESLQSFPCLSTRR